MALEVLSYRVGPMDNNTCVILDRVHGEAAVVDPAFGSETVVAAIKREGWRLLLNVNTHAHLDHVAGNAAFADAFAVAPLLHPDDRPLYEGLAQQAQWFGVEAPRPVEPAYSLSDRCTLVIGDFSVGVLHTPGHSPGSVCLTGDGWAIVGDLVFAGSIGRADLPGGNYDTLMASIHDRILPMDDSVVLHCGHGPSTTVGQERHSNPFLVHGER